MYFPIGWVNLEPTVQGFVKDSFILAESSTKLSDYAAYVMPIIRVLEYRIKKICLDCNIMINDKSGFKYFPDVENPKDGKWIFTMSCGKITGVNPEISVMSSSAKQSIIECYDFLLKNRHEMFHANQILMGTKLVETKEEAIQMIIEASELIEKSLTYKTVQTN